MKRKRSETNSSSSSWTLHYSKSQKMPYYFNGHTNKRYWADEDLPKGWAWTWRNGKKWYFDLFHMASGKGCWDKKMITHLLNLPHDDSSNNSNT